MAYRIDYTLSAERVPVSEPVRRDPRKKRGGVWVAVLLLAALLARWLFPGGIAPLETPASTKAAVAELMDGLKNGEPVGEALTVFCREIIQNGQVGD